MLKNAPTTETHHLLLKDQMEQFRRDLKTLSSKGVFRRHIVLRNSAILSDDQYYNLKESICTQYKVNFTDVLMVGSAKLGFSIKPTRRWGVFSDESDIDIAIVNKGLFESFWLDLYEYSRSGAFWPEFLNFQNFFFRGWIRPDKFPPSRMFKRSLDWWEFFNETARSRKYNDYPIRAGLYYNWNFLESYQCLCIEQCQRNTVHDNLG